MLRVFSFYVVCEIIFLPPSPALLFFPKRSICGSHGLLVFTILTGPLLLVFFSPHTHTQTCTQWVLTADTQLHSLLQLHLLSPWRPCLLLNPPAHKHTHTQYDREIGRLRLPLCLIWCYRTHRITAPSKPRPICTNTHTAVGLAGCSRPMLNTEP